MVKNLVLSPILVHLPQIQAVNFFFFFKNLTSSVTRYNGQLSSCTISEKTNDPILRKLSDGRCLTNVEHPKTNLKLKKT